MSFPIVYGIAAFLSRNTHDLALVFTQVASAPLALLLGFICGKRKLGLVVGLTLAVALIPTFEHLIWSFWRDGPYILPIAGLGGWLGWFGANLREKHFPFASQEAFRVVSRPAVIELLSELEARMEAKQSASYLNKGTKP